MGRPCILAVAVELETESMICFSETELSEFSCHLDVSFERQTSQRWQQARVPLTSDATEMGLWQAGRTGLVIALTASKERI